MNLIYPDISIRWLYVYRFLFQYGFLPGKIENYQVEMDLHPNVIALGMQHPNEKICIPGSRFDWDAASQCEIRVRTGLNLR